MKTNPKSLQKQHGHKHTKHMKKDFKYININQSIIANQIHEFQTRFKPLNQKFNHRVLSP